MPLVSIILINYNGEKFLKLCLDSLLKQTYHPTEILFIDNASTDQSLKSIKSYASQVKLILNQQNLGYAAAANQGIKQSAGEYLLICNPDIVFAANFLEKAVARLKKNPKIGALTGKILKYDFERQKKTKLIDSLGLFCYRNRRIIDLGQGLEDTGQFEKEQPVFGVSGACPLYRRQALKDIKLDQEYFDEDFFMYKEDIDLSWRLQLRGWQALYFPKAVAYHGRGTGVLKRFTHLEVLKSRRHLNRFQKKYAYTNQRLMQVKNELCANFFRDFFPIVWKEILIFGYILVREPYLLASLWQFFKKLPRALKKRRAILRRKKVSAKDMQKWFSRQPL